EVERVVSGQGLVNIHRALYSAGSDHFDLDALDAPMKISRAALAGESACCKEALDVFVAAYGSEAGNLALRALAVGGVYIGGGIAPRILPALITGTFMQAFRAKSPLERLLESMPVKVILNHEAGLLGAAVYAANGGRGTR